MNLEAINKKLERKRQRLAAEEQRAKAANEKILLLKEEIRTLEDTAILQISRAGRTAAESLALLQASLPAPEPEEAQNVEEQDAPESEEIIDETL